MPKITVIITTIKHKVY